MTVTLWKRRDDYWQGLSTDELRAEIQRRATNVQTWNDLPYEQAVRDILSHLPAAVSKRYGDAPPEPPARRSHGAANDYVPIRKEGESMIQNVADIEKRAGELVVAGKAKDVTDGLQQVFKADPFSYELYRAAHTLGGQPVPVRPVVPEPAALPVEKNEGVVQAVERLVAERRATLAKRAEVEDVAESYRVVFRQHEGLHTAYRKAVSV